MSQFSGKAVVSVYELPVDYDARSDSRAERDHDKVFHASRHTVSHFAYGGGVGIVCHGYRHSQLVAEHFGERYYTLAPVYVCRMFDGAFIEIGVRRAYAHSLDFLDSANLLYDYLQRFYGGVNIFFRCGKSLCLDCCCGFYFSTAVHYPEYGIGAAEIQTDHVRFGY